MKIYEEPRKAREVPNFFSKFKLTASLTSVSKAVDNWSRDCHERSIVLTSPSSEQINLTRTMLMEREENPCCCGLYSNKYWRHYIEDVKSLNLSSMDGSVEIIHKSPKNTTNVVSSSTEQNQIRRPKIYSSAVINVDLLQQFCNILVQNLHPISSNYAKVCSKKEYSIIFLILFIQY
ncbi:hypothetical protein PHJA_000330400 [Phtheirospermum japonicum]|uniref:Uncharacterized protein n=1 Tax=Phtheirospermum japonicum TaxID=374723 RepID=A0A830BII7_9LAMI|nr:hypothetical protein PHJA_000330400 [Phtheirospermum japonicum]